MADIYLTDYIGWFGTEAATLIPEIHAVTDDAITLYVNSPGGNVFDGIAIMAALQQHPARVETRVLGLAASIASVIIAGASDSVSINPSARVMVHDPVSIVIGKASDFRKEADLLDSITDDLVNIYDRRMNVGRAEVRRMMADETWYTAAQAVEVGLADQVDGQPAKPATALFDRILAQYHNVPDDLYQREAESVGLKDLEKVLRNAGLSRSEASGFVARGKLALQREAGERPIADMHHDGLVSLSETLRGGVCQRPRSFSKT